LEPVPGLDELMANAWPPVEVIRDGRWRYRWSSGVTRRANSVLCIGGADRIEELVDRGEAFYGSRHGVARFQVSSVSAPRGLVDHLERRGYVSESATVVMVADVAEVLRRTKAALGTVTTTPRATDAWFDAYWSVESTRGRGADDATICRASVLAPALPTTFAAIDTAGESWAVGQLVCEARWGGLQCMATVGDRRRRGGATGVLHVLAAHAQRAGCAGLYLAVAKENDGARRLYERSGFRIAHGYCYYVPIGVGDKA
jgi:ribosomal protein S18 acetylase RimI-like enzyme